MNRRASVPIYIDDWKSDAISDRSFYYIFFQSIFRVGSPLDNYLVAIYIIVASLSCIFVNLAFDQIKDISLIVDASRQFAGFGASLAVSILGFLITGFSIFSAMMKVEHFHVLAKYKIKGRDISEFKFIMYNFIYIFANYIIYLIMCTFIYFFFVYGSPIWYICSILYANIPDFFNVLSAIILVIISGYTVFVILLLRSFIWNMYQGLLFAIFYVAPVPGHSGDEN